MRILSALQMQELDRATIESVGIPGAVLMESAGRGMFGKICELVPGALEKSVLVLAGRGNNGGDGFVIARLFHQAGARVTTALFSAADSVRGAARANLEALKKTGGAVLEITDEQQWREASSHLAHAGIIVDALLGTGLSSPVSGLLKEVIDSVNSRGRAYVAAVDIPSGIDGTTGAVLGSAIRANLTCTFAFLKRGLALHPGAGHAGRLEVIDIGIPAGLPIEGPGEYLLDTAMLAGFLPARQPDSHKGTYGHAVVFAGSPGKTGAAALAAQAAMRAGAGLVTVGVPASLNPVLEAKLTEPMTVPLPEEAGGFLGTVSLSGSIELIQGKSAIALGPGIGDSPETTAFVAGVIEAAAAPLVIDADGLNAIARDTAVLKRLRAPAVLTPHPGEMARLAGLSTNEVQADRTGVSRAFAKKYGITLVLKGSRTIIAGHDGSIFINPTGNPGMASGGMGDALTGLITGLIAQGLDPLKAALLGVYVHGAIGDAIARERGPLGILATDIIERIPAGLAIFISR